MEISIEGIKKIIPHRAPMLMIDAVDEVRELDYIRGHKAVTVNEPCFSGHFPGYAVYPGIFVIEALAQISSVMILMTDANQGRTTYYSKMAKVRFWGEVRPGDVIDLESNLVGETDGVYLCRTKASVKGQEVFSGEISLLVVDVLEEGEG